MSSGQPSDPDRAFADVLNGLALGGGARRGRRRPKPRPPAAQPSPQSSPQPGQDVARQVEWPWTSPETRRTFDPFVPAGDRADGPAGDDADLPADAAMVRPYAWTRGRTKSTVDLRIETMVSTSEHGEDIEALTQSEHREIAELCGEPRSVAEVATLLAVPLGVAKVLLGDMANLGLVIVHKTATGGASKAHLTLMERVLSGLRRL